MEETINKIVDAGIAGVQQLAQSMGTTGEYLLQVGVQGKIAEGIGLLVISFILCILLVVGWIVTIKIEKSLTDSSEGQGVAFMITLILSVAALFITLFNIYDGILNLLSPEYMLFKDILKMIN